MKKFIDQCFKSHRIKHAKGGESEDVFTNLTKLTKM
jgi:hypothetical protein